MNEPLSDLTLSHDTILAEVVAELRRLILSRAYKPGDRLVQNDLAEQLGVSRTPIREALHQLAKEGLVTISPYRGASVASFEPADLEGIYHIRIALESYAARLVARNITSQEIATLREILAEMERAYNDGEPDVLLEVNRKFYMHMYQATRQPRLYEMIINHLDLSRQYRRLYFYIEHLAANTVQEHVKMIEAMASGDENAADMLMRTGLEATAKGLLNALMQSESERSSK
ncbi:MAG: GntR family transcriptional regulator [Chloroflexi bacterium]|nr:GntR family transcriptional regulator [Chloroflexota bacterium]